MGSALVLLALAAPARAQLASPSSAWSSGTTAPIRVRSDESATLHDGVSGERLCTAPCGLTLRRGNHLFGVSVPGREMRRAPVVRIRRPVGTLWALHINHAGLRLGGALTLGIGLSAGALAGLGGLIAVFTSTDGSTVSVGSVFAIGAAIDLFLALAIGLPLLFAGDGASVRFEETGPSALDR